MTPMPDTIAGAYLRLAFALEQHIPGYVDAYAGPAEKRTQAQAAGTQPVAELAREAADLADAIAREASMDDQRRDFLARQVHAMQASLRILGGERPALADETEALYDIRPEWVDEGIFQEAHRALDELLPAGDSLAERMTAHKKSLEITVERAKPLLGVIVAELQRRTRARFPLPADEAFEITFVNDQPWGAYNWFLGGRRSRIEINTDLPLRITDLPGLLAHEGYPGHHTELSIKETRLLDEHGWTEHSVALLNTPSCVIAEGIATRALEVLMSDEEQINWFRAELFPRADFLHLDAACERAIQHAKRALAGVAGNAAFLLHDRGASGEEVVAYCQRWALNRPDEARKSLSFISNPLYHSYIFTYHLGGALLDALFAAGGERDAWFTRLLTEPVTPTQVRAWAAG